MIRFIEEDEAVQFFQSIVKGRDNLLDVGLVSFCEIFRILI